MESQEQRHHPSASTASGHIVKGGVPLRDHIRETSTHLEQVHRSRDHCILGLREPL